MLLPLGPACTNVQFTTTGTGDTICDKLQMTFKSTSQNEFAEMGKAGEMKSADLLVKCAVISCLQNSVDVQASMWLSVNRTSRDNLYAWPDRIMSLV